MPLFLLTITLYIPGHIYNLLVCKRQKKKKYQCLMMQPSFTVFLAQLKPTNTRNVTRDPNCLKCLC